MLALPGALRIMINFSTFHNYHMTNRIHVPGYPCFLSTLSFSSGISVDVSPSRFHQTTLSLLSLVEPALTSLGLMCTVGQGEKLRMHVICLKSLLLYLRAGLV